MRIAFETLGCKVNQYETAALRRRFEAAGYELAEPDGHADVYVLNSCTVTAAGDQKSRQILRRFRRQNPGAVVCLCGCFPQAFPNEAAAIAEADVILGSRKKTRLPEAVALFLETGERVVEIAAHEPGEPFEDDLAEGFFARTRATVKIEDGCERFCSYCIIPTARGPVRSKRPEAIADELRGLAAAGYGEAVLVGVNLSCYGQDLGLRLIDAVRAACESGIPRVRLGSLEPELLGPGDIAALAGLPGLCPQFHLSLQSGCDETLLRMARHYSAEDYRRIAESLRDAFPGCAITTDIMVGFPGETGLEFEQSLAFCRDMAFARTHVFAFSARPGTAAAGMPGQIAAEIKSERSKRMAELAARSRREFLLGQLGKPSRVLAEARGRDGLWHGYSGNYTPFLIEADDDLSGRIITVIPSEVRGDGCFGRWELEIGNW